MFDAKLLPLQHGLLRGPAQRLARWMTADQISLVGFALGALTVPALAFGFYGLALVLLALNRVADGLDGAVARINGPTDRGAFLDIALDFVFYALFPLGFAFADPGGECAGGGGADRQFCWHWIVVSGLCQHCGAAGFAGGGLSQQGDILPRWFDRRL